MNSRTVVTILLMAFVLVSVVTLVIKETRPPPQEQATERDGVVVFLFHGPERCPTCETLESSCREAVENGFPAALKSGRLRVASINYLAPESERYRRDFGAAYLSVVLAEVSGGRPKRLKNLIGIWDHIDNREQLVSYLRVEILRFLEGE